jgi:uncharacterized protein YdeI (YjbR/CyaY-like superfamily)
MLSPMPKPTAKDFYAVLERIESRLNWVVIRVPDVEKHWGKRGRLAIKGQINGCSFRTSLFPSKRGDHLMIVNKRMQRNAKVAAGSRARFHLEPDLAPRSITIPPELKRLVTQDKALLKWFEKLNYSTRKWITDWITDVKSSEARARRSEQIAERLLLTMEAEQEPPPILQLAFARNPRAAEGWHLMSLAKRRAHLLAIFYYRTPESRARRMQQALDEAASLAARKTRPT